MQKLALESPTGLKYGNFDIFLGPLFAHLSVPYHHARRVMPAAVMPVLTGYWRLQSDNVPNSRVQVGPGPVKDR